MCFCEKSKFQLYLWFLFWKNVNDKQFLHEFNKTYLGRKGEKLTPKHLQQRV